MFGHFSVSRCAQAESHRAAAVPPERAEHDAEVAALAASFSSKRLVIWDFDGSLCDTEPLHFAAYAHAFSFYGHEVKEHEYYRRFTQFNDGILRECEAYGLALDDAARRDIRARKVARYASLIASGAASPFVPMEAILEATLDLGWQWAVASNSPESENRLILQQFASVFSTCAAILGPDSCGSKVLQKKPAPDLFVETLQRLGARPSEALIVEDTDKGLQAAEAAGIDAICVSTRYNADIPMQARHLARLTHLDILELMRRIRTKNTGGV